MSSVYGDPDFTTPDTDRLNWLEGKGNGDLWVARESISGRGYRLHNISEAVASACGLVAYHTVRDAIDYRRLYDNNEQLIGEKHGA